MRTTDAAIDPEGAEGRLGRAVRSFLTPRPTPTTRRDEELRQSGRGLALACGMAATAWGDGPTVLLAHGWESRGTHWGAFVAGLVGAGFRAVAVDAPAHGASAGERTTVVEYARLLAEAGREVGPVLGAVGHSFGAGALALALDRGLVVGRVALIGGPASLAGVIERWGRGHGLADDEIPAFLGLVEREVGEAVGPLDIARVAARMARPALVVHDRGDDEVPVGEGLAVASAWPGARLLVTERYGHRRILIAKEVVRAVVDFLAEGRDRTRNH